jgi:hypothetical protein
MAASTPRNDFTCASCPNSFNSKEHLENHLFANRHEVECLTCHKRFDSFYDRHDHYEHLNHWPFHCFVCDNPFTTVEHCKEHKATTSCGIIPCKFCNKRFVSVGLFDDHTCGGHIAVIRSDPKKKKKSKKAAAAAPVAARPPVQAASYASAASRSSVSVERPSRPATSHTRAASRPRGILSYEQSHSSAVPVASRAPSIVIKPQSTAAKFAAPAKAVTVTKPSIFPATSALNTTTKPTPTAARKTQPTLVIKPPVSINSTSDLLSSKCK